MNEQKAFEKWWKNDSSWGGEQLAEYHLAKSAWQACAEQKDKEIAALRELLNEIVDCELIDDDGLYSLGIIDENGNPTKLLTGEEEQ